MTPNKNGKVIFATHLQTNDQPQQALPTELPQNTQFLLFSHPLLKF